VYSKPLFSGSSASQVYRPKKVDSDVYGDEGDEGADLLDKSTSRFRADHEFEGVSEARRNTAGVLCCLYFSPFSSSRTCIRACVFSLERNETENPQNVACSFCAMI